MAEPHRKEGRFPFCAGRGYPVPSVRTVVLCPFSAGTVLWQAQSGAWTLSVCVRGTFSPVPGREALLVDPQEPVAADRHLGDDPRNSLYAPSDLVPYKPRVDVVLVGSAFACLLYTSPSPRDRTRSRMPSSA